MNNYVQQTACSDCPFNESGSGRRLRDSLGIGRFEGIITDLQSNKTFPCHQTVRSSGGKGPQKICAGALAWQRQHHCIPDSVQIIERLIALKEGRNARW